MSDEHPGITLGDAWADVKLNSAENEVTLQLVQDHPIEGRILTTDGQPAKGVEVSVARLYRKMNDSDNETNPRSTMVSAEMFVKTASNHSGTYTNYPEWPGQGPTNKPLRNCRLMRDCSVNSLGH